MLVSEVGVEGLVRPVCKVDGCGGSGDVVVFQAPLPGGYLTFGDGPSGPVAKCQVDAPRIRSTTRTFLKFFLTAAAAAIAGEITDELGVSHASAPLR